MIDANDSTQYQITVANGRADSPPPPPVVAGLVFQYVGQENQGNYYFDSRAGTRVVNSLVYIYTVRAMPPGQYVIPGQEVGVNGVAMRTMALTLTAEGSGRRRREVGLRKRFPANSSSPGKARTSARACPWRCAAISARRSPGIPIPTRC